MKKEKIQLIPQKHKRSSETIMNNYTKMNWKTLKKWINSQTRTTIKIESGRNRKSKQNRDLKNNTKNQHNVKLFSEKINKMDKPLARQTKKKKRRPK